MESSSESWGLSLSVSGRWGERDRKEMEKESERDGERINEREQLEEKGRERERVIECKNPACSVFITAVAYHHIICLGAIVPSTALHATNRHYMVDSATVPAVFPSTHRLAEKCE